MKILPAGESALIAYFDDDPNPRQCEEIQATAALLQEILGPVLMDLTPSYASLLVMYDPFSIDEQEVRQAIMQARSRARQQESHPSQLIRLPVLYHHSTGPDLASLAQHAGISEDEVIHLHQSVEYYIYSIGFAPGFAYLGEVDERIARPRLSTPRSQVPRGAVAIADRQTAVYPEASPGGWNLIGNCPLTLFDPQQDPPSPFRVGDRVQFYAIDEVEYRQLGGHL